MNAWNIYKAYRLYSDVNFAFYYGVIDNCEGEFEIVSAAHPFTDGSATIAVPSRLYYPDPTAEKPFSGVRVSGNQCDYCSISNSGSDWGERCL
jgi:hypothetical protein